MADRSQAIRAGARRKREQAVVRASATIRELDERGESITFQSVARHAGVSRQWLYEHAELRSEIERLRDGTWTSQNTVPAAERSSLASLKKRLATLADENRGLRQEIKDLKTELALAYGTRRAAGSGSGT